MWWWWLGCPAGDGTVHVPTTNEAQTDPTGVPPPMPTSVSTLAQTSPTDTSPIGSGSVLQFDGPAPRNLLIVSLDTTRRDRIGRYSGSADTPNLDAVLAGCDAR